MHEQTTDSEDDPAFAPVLAQLGRPGSADLVPTPALLCDLDLLEKNIQAMQRTADAADIALRPHTKSHKSAAIARMQLGAGAAGICVAKLSEAEALLPVLSADGAPPVSVLVTSPLGGPGAARRAAGLARRCHLSLVVDHVDGVTELAAAVTDDAPVTVLCDVDVGLDRTGVTGPGAALEIAALVASAPSLRFGDVQVSAGHAQHIAGRDLRRQAVGTATERLATVIDALESAGHDVPLRSGGGTGTGLLDIEHGVLNELQTGSYVFMDREYRDALGSDPESAFAQCLTLATTVISTDQTGFVTVDAGLKSMATDAGVPTIIDHHLMPLRVLRRRAGPGHRHRCLDARPWGAPAHGAAALRPDGGPARLDLAHPGRHCRRPDTGDRPGALVLTRAAGAASGRAASVVGDPRAGSPVTPVTPSPGRRSPTSSWGCWAKSTRTRRRR